MRWIHLPISKVLLGALVAMWPACMACACCCASSEEVAAVSKPPCCSAAAHDRPGDRCECYGLEGGHRNAALLDLVTQRLAGIAGFVDLPLDLRPADVTASELSAFGRMVLSRPVRILYGVWRN